MNRPPWYQVIISNFHWIVMGFSLVAGTVEAINNTVTLIPPIATYAGTALILLALAVVSLILRHSSQPWLTTDHRRVRITSLGRRWFLGAAGVIVALWLPRLAAPASPTVPPLITPTATSEEILILLAEFEDQCTYKYDTAGAIYLALETALHKYDLPNVRLVQLPQTFKRSDLKAVKQLGQRYSATLFIWGHYDDAGMYPRFTLLQENKVEVPPEKLADKLTNLARPPDDFTLYINCELPAQMTYLTQFTIGQIFYLQKSYSQALALFKAAIETANTIETEPFQHSLAVTYFYKGYIYQAVKKDLDQAILDYTRGIELDPNFAAYTNRGLAYADSGDLPQAISDYNKAIKLDPNDALAYYNRGNAYANSGDLPQAISDYNKAIELEPNDASAYYNRGIAYYNFGDLPQAIRDFTKTIELEPNYIKAFNNRGNAYANSGDLPQAIRDYNKAIKLDPNKADVYYNRGNAYADSGDLPQAIRDYTQAIKLAPNDAKTYYNRGNAYYNSSDLPQAIRDFTKAIELEPNDASAYNNLCWTASLSGRAADFMDACERAVKLDPNVGYIRDSRGLARALTGDYSGAIEDFKFFVEWSRQNGMYELYGPEREAWIAELAAGQNPFDQVTLEELRTENFLAPNWADEN